MRQAMFSLNTHGPDNECFMAGMRGLVLQHAPSASFRSLMAIFAPYVGCCINDVTIMVANLEEAESREQ